MTCSGFSACARASSVSASMKSVMPCTSECVRRSCTLPSRQVRSFSLALAPLPSPLKRGRCFEQAIGRVGAAVEDHVLGELAQFGRDVVVERELAGVDDAHVHAGADGVVQEHRVHGLAHGLVATEGEREVRDAARDVRQRHLLADLARGLDEVDAVAVVLFDAGRHGEDVRIEDDVLGREADLLGQELIGALANVDLALDGVGLALLVEGHDDDGGAVAQHLLRVIENCASPSFMEIELTMALPCTHLSPASMTLHLELSIMIGTREMSGSEAIRFRNVVMAFSESSRPSSMLTSSDHGAGLDLLARDGEGGRVVVGLD